MFFVLSKTVPHLVMPLTLIVGSLIISFLTKSLIWKRRLRIFGLGLLILSSNPFINNQVFKLWELPPTPIAQLPASKTVGVVLTGVVKKEKLPHDRVYFAEGADRVTQAIQLYKSGHLQKILITGGKGSFSKSEIREATQLREVFLMCSVPDEDLIIESNSRNTRENAVNSSKILKEQFPGYHYVLITSSFHMRRSIGCFEKSGIQVIGFCTDFKTGDYPPKFTSYVIPDPGAINKWHILIREFLGMTAYKMMGYL